MANVGQTVPEPGPNRPIWAEVGQVLARFGHDIAQHCRNRSIWAECKDLEQLATWGQLCRNFGAISTRSTCSITVWQLVSLYRRRPLKCRRHLKPGAATDSDPSRRMTPTLVELGTRRIRMALRAPTCTRTGALCGKAEVWGPEPVARLAAEPGRRPRHRKGCRRRDRNWHPEGQDASPGAYFDEL